jgi:hypothetical protein
MPLSNNKASGVNAGSRRDFAAHQLDLGGWAQLAFTITGAWAL